MVDKYKFQFHHVIVHSMRFSVNVIMPALRLSFNTNPLENMVLNYDWIFSFFRLRHLNAFECIESYRSNILLKLENEFIYLNIIEKLESIYANYLKNKPPTLDKRNVILNIILLSICGFIIILLLVIILTSLNFILVSS